jgi:hypothetical protein
MTRPVTIPIGSWPLEMNAAIAAGYCSEPSVEAFLSKVARGIYPKPARIAGCLPKWHRLKLDADIARRHNLHLHVELHAEDISELV